MSATIDISQVSDAVAYSAMIGFYDPVTLQVFDDATGAVMVQSEHALGKYVTGIDDFSVADGTASTTTGVTVAENTAALKQAAALAAQQLGLTGIPTNQWSPDQTVHYLDAFRAIVLANPENFNAQTIATAQNMHTADLANRSNLANFGVAVTDFVAGAANAAGGSAIGVTAKGITDALTSLGQSLSGVAAIAPYLLPIGFAVFVYLAVKSVGRDPGGQAKKIISSFA